MKSIRTVGSLAVSIVVLSSLAAQADHSVVQGRTGLPVVREGGENVWIKKGVVEMKMVGGDLVTTQTFKLAYPGPPVEKGPQNIKVAVREDYYTARDNGVPEVTSSSAKGFKSFNVMVDGRTVRSSTLPWEINDKKDTATRWREWNISFQPGQTRQMKIVSRSPAAFQGGHKIVQFVSKDLGHWRDKPDTLEIRFAAPGLTEANLAGLEPKADNINSRAVQWMYRKADPNRDVFIMLPAKKSAHR